MLSFLINFKNFVLSNKDRIITYDKMLSKTSNGIFISLMNKLSLSLSQVRRFILKLKIKNLLNSLGV